MAMGHCSLRKPREQKHSQKWPPRVLVGWVWVRALRFCRMWIIMGGRQDMSYGEGGLQVGVRQVDGVGNLQPTEGRFPMVWGRGPGTTVSERQWGSSPWGHRQALDRLQGGQELCQGRPAGRKGWSSMTSWPLH